MPLVNDSVIELVAGLVDVALRNIGAITAEVYDSNAETSLLDLSDPFDIDEGAWVEIDGNEYKVIEFTAASPPADAQILVSNKTGAALGVTSFKTLAPWFFHGTYQMINDRMTARGNNDIRRKMSAVYLFYTLKEKKDMTGVSVHSRVPRLQMAFLDASHVDYTPDQHEAIMQAQVEQSDKFLEQVKLNQFIDNTAIGQVDRTYWPNFGVFAASNGDMRAFTDVMASGCVIEFDLPLFHHFDDCNIADFEFAKCAPVLIQDSDGNTIEVKAAGSIYVDDVQVTSFFDFPEENDDVVEITVPSGAAGTYANEVLVNVATVVYELDTGSGFNFVTLPFTAATGNGLRITITRTDNNLDSSVTISD